MKTVFGVIGRSFGLAGIIGFCSATSVQAATGGGGVPPGPEAGLVRFSSSVQPAEEAAGSLIATLVRTGGSTGAATAFVSVTAGGDATAYADFQPYTSVSVTWANGDSSPKTVSIPIVNDTLEETDETFDLQITSVVGTTLGSPSAAFGVIHDDDWPAPDVSFSSQLLEYHENMGTGAAEVALSRTPSVAAVIQYQITSGSAQAGSDFSAPAYTGQLTFPAGTTSSQTIPFSILSDAASESDEQFTIVLSPVSNCAVAIGDAIAAVTIHDGSADFIEIAGDEEPPAGSSGASPAGGCSSTKTQAPLECAGVVTHKVWFTTVVTGNVKYSFTEVAGTASQPGALRWTAEEPEGADFIASDNVTGVVPTASGSKSYIEVPFAVIEDSRHERDEYFLIELEAPPGSRIKGKIPVRIQIKDNDPLGARFVDAPVSVPENQGNGQLLVAPNGVVDKAFKVFVTINNGTAIKGLDYNHTPNTTKGTYQIAFPKSSGNADGLPSPVPFSVISDSLWEAPEDFIATLDSKYAKAPSAGKVIIEGFSVSQVETSGNPSVFLDVTTSVTGTSNTYRVALDYLSPSTGEWLPIPLRNEQGSLVALPITKSPPHATQTTRYRWDKWRDVGVGKSVEDVRVRVRATTNPSGGASPQTLANLKVVPKPGEYFVYYANQFNLPDDPGAAGAWQGSRVMTCDMAESSPSGADLSALVGGNQVRKHRLRLRGGSTAPGSLQIVEPARSYRLGFDLRFENDDNDMSDCGLSVTLRKGKEGQEAFTTTNSFQSVSRQSQLIPNSSAAPWGSAELYWGDWHRVEFVRTEKLGVMETLLYLDGRLKRRWTSPFSGTDSGWNGAIAEIAASNLATGRNIEIDNIVIDNASDYTGGGNFRESLYNHQEFVNETFNSSDRIWSHAERVLPIYDNDPIYTAQNYPHPRLTDEMWLRAEPNQFYLSAEEGLIKKLPTVEPGTLQVVSPPSIADYDVSATFSFPNLAAPGEVGFLVRYQHSDYDAIYDIANDGTPGTSDDGVEDAADIEKLFPPEMRSGPVPQYSKFNFGHRRYYKVSSTDGYRTVNITKHRQESHPDFAALNSPTVWQIVQNVAVTHRQSGVPSADVRVRVMVYGRIIEVFVDGLLVASAMDQTLATNDIDGATFLRGSPSVYCGPGSAVSIDDLVVSTDYYFWGKKQKDDAGGDAAHLYRGQVAAAPGFGIRFQMEGHDGIDIYRVVNPVVSGAGAPPRLRSMESKLRFVAAAGGRVARVLPRMGYIRKLASSAQTVEDMDWRTRLLLNDFGLIGNGVLPSKTLSPGVVETYPSCELITALNNPIYFKGWSAQPDWVEPEADGWFQLPHDSPRNPDAAIPLPAEYWHVFFQHFVSICRRNDVFIEMPMVDDPMINEHVKMYGARPALDQPDTRLANMADPRFIHDPTMAMFTFENVSKIIGPFADEPAVFAWPLHSEPGTARQNSTGWFIPSDADCDPCDRECGDLKVVWEQGLRSTGAYFVDFWRACTDHDPTVSLSSLTRDSSWRAVSEHACKQRFLSGIPAAGYGKWTGVPICADEFWNADEILVGAMGEEFSLAMVRVPSASHPTKKWAMARFEAYSNLHSYGAPHAEYEDIAREYICDYAHGNVPPMFTEIGPCAPQDGYRNEATKFRFVGQCYIKNQSRGNALNRAHDSWLCESNCLDSDSCGSLGSFPDRTLPDGDYYGRRGLSVRSILDGNPSFLDRPDVYAAWYNWARTAELFLQGRGAYCWWPAETWGFKFSDGSRWKFHYSEANLYPAVPADIYLGTTGWTNLDLDEARYNSFFFSYLRWLNGLERTPATVSCDD